MNTGLRTITILALAAGTTLAHDPRPRDPGTDINQANTTMVYGDWIGPDGQLDGGLFHVPIDEEAQQIIDAIEIANRGVPDNRVDIVIVGDGYTAGEQTLFQAHANNIMNSFFQYEPFTSYEPYFRVTNVGVISNESGVDNDPTQGINRDTALDMSYWCSGIERLLCVSVPKAYQAAAAAPDIDQIIAIANSTKYGGAGYPSNNLGTVAGGNGAAPDIAIHEMGHSLGDLADEYTYGGPTTYTGNEFSTRNVSIFDRTTQLNEERKWWQWMDEDVDGFDGPVSTYEGGNYSVNGVYRPSNNSMMRSLGREFNLPSAERLIHQIYKEVNPIDDGTPNGTTVEADGTLWVQPMQPNGHNLSVAWFLNDVIIVNALGQNTLDVSTLNLVDGTNEIRVEVVDPTPWVRNDAIRNAFLSESRTYTVESCVDPADLNNDGELDFFDVSAFLSAYNAQDSVADFNNDGQFNFFDVSAFLTAFNEGGCP